jgi:hypothetical protein
MAIEHDEPDPPPKVYGFKDRAFKRDNAPASASPPPPSAKEHAILAGHVAPATRKIPPSGGVNRAADPNDVYAVLQQNLAVERKIGIGEVEIRKVKSRRKRDYWLLVVPSVLLLSVITWLGRGNPFVLVCGIAGIVVATLGITWIMFHIMEDY